MTDRKWYAETRGFDATWRPAVFHQDEKPTEKTHDGKRVLRNVREIFGTDKELNLETLRAKYAASN